MRFLITNHISFHYKSTDFRAISSNVIAICIGTPVTRRIVHDSEYRNAVPALPPFKARNVKMAQTTINLGDAFVW